MHAVHWPTVLACAALGVLAGAWCGRFAHHYALQLAARGMADRACCLAALRQSMKFRPAREARRSGFTDLHSLPAALLAVGYALLFAARGPDAALWGPAAAMALLLALALIDARTGLLPDALTYSLLGLGLALAWAGYGLEPKAALLGAAFGYALLYAICGVCNWLFRQPALGAGDLKLYAALGAWLGPPLMPWLLFAACAAAALYAMGRQRTLSPRGTLPFGPFLAMSGAALLVLRALLPAWTGL